MSFLALIAWSIAYPFLYGLLISRLFGISKPLDQWILVCLQISSTVLSLIIAIMVYGSLYDLLGLKSSVTLVVPYIAGYACMFVCHGLVWQFLLRDRKMNGFLISLLCCAISAIPIATISLGLHFKLF